MSKVLCINRRTVRRMCKRLKAGGSNIAEEAGSFILCSFFFSEITEAAALAIYQRSGVTSFLIYRNATYVIMRFFRDRSVFSG